jgi:hypothetical protein
LPRSDYATQLDKIPKAGSYCLQGTWLIDEAVRKIAVKLYPMFQFREVGVFGGERFVLVFPGSVAL